MKAVVRVAGWIVGLALVACVMFGVGMASLVMSKGAECERNGQEVALGGPRGLTPECVDVDGGGTP